MAIYAYNLQFSLANAQNGMFTPYSNTQVGLGVSSVWIQYNGVGNQPTVYDFPSVVAPLTANQWSLVPQAQQNPLSINSVPVGTTPTDYIFVRVFPLESLPSPQIRMTAVLGRGTNGAPSGSNNQSQSPFLTGQNARPVIDFDNTPSVPNWVPVGTDGAWTFCLGGVHGNGNDYSTNVGVSVYVPAGPYSGQIYTFGHDPQLHVVMPSMKAETAA
jgi:hypothetical protein